MCNVQCTYSIDSLQHSLQFWPFRRMYHPRCHRPAQPGRQRARDLPPARPHCTARHPYTRSAQRSRHAAGRLALESATVPRFTSKLFYSSIFCLYYGITPSVRFMNVFPFVSPFVCCLFACSDHFTFVCLFHRLLHWLFCGTRFDNNVICSCFW